MKKAILLTILVACGVGSPAGGPGSAQDARSATPAGSAQGSGPSSPAAPEDGPLLRPRTAMGSIAPQGGSITGVIAGTGVLGGGTSGHVTLSADTSYMQRRVAGTCAGGTAIGTVNADGTVTCNAAGITNSAGANVIPKSDGVNLVASSVTDSGGFVTTPSEVWGAWSVPNNAVALAGGAAIVSTTATDVGFDFGATATDVYWRNKVATGGHLDAYIGAGTSPGNTNNWLSVDGAGAVTLGNTLAMGSHKITGLANGTASDDAAAFGQIASSINTAVSGTGGDLAAFTSAHVLGNFAGSSPSACPAGQVLTRVTSAATGALTQTCTAIGTAGGVTGTGTSGKVPLWSGTTSQTDSSISDDLAGNVSTTSNVAINVGGTGPVTALTLASTDAGATTAEVRQWLREGGAGWQGIAGRYNSGAPYLAWSVSAVADTWAERMKLTSSLLTDEVGLSVLGDTTIGDTSADHITWNAVGASALDMGTHQIHNVTDPSSAQDAATKNYVDAVTTNEITGTLTANTMPIATGTHTVGDSAIVTTTLAGLAMYNVGGSSGFSVHSTSFLATAAGQVYAASSLDTGFSTNASATLYINKVGYQTGTSQFRDLEIDDGKGNATVIVTGSTKAIEVVGAVTLDSTLAVTGNATLGDALTDTTSVNGDFTVNTDDILLDHTTHLVYISGEMTSGTLTSRGSSTLGAASTDVTKVAGRLEVNTSTATISTCGTGVSLHNGNANSGYVTTGTSASTCTINLGATFTNAPNCTVSEVQPSGTLDTALYMVSTSTTQMSFHYAGVAEGVMYVCMGR